MRQRGSRCASEGNGGAAFIERGEELLAHHRVEHERGKQQHASERDDEHWRAEREAQKSLAHEELYALHDEPIAVTARGWLEQQGAQYGDHRERNDKRRRHAGDRGDGNRREKPAFDPFQSEQRQKHQDDEHGSVEDGVSDFTGCSRDDLQRRTSF